MRDLTVTGVQTCALPIWRLRKPHGQQGEVSVFPLVENPGAVFVPRARLYVVNEERQVVAGPLIVARRRAYHREWLLGFVGVTPRAVVESWRGPLLRAGEGPGVPVHPGR